jgi:hypothetical protein
MVVTTYLCPYTETCPFYKNWKDQRAPDRRVDVISKIGDSPFHCLVLGAVEDPATEGGIPIMPELGNRLSNSNERSFFCSHIKLLNLLDDLTKVRL